MTVLNPWERLAARVPSPFVSDPHFTPKKSSGKVPAPKEHPLSLGPLSAKGERAHLLRQAARRRQPTPAACK